MGNLSKKVGRRIKQLRESLKIKQFELAEMLDMEPSNLTRIESGYQMPKEENLVKIAGILGVKEKDLFDFGEEQNKEELIQKINSLLEQCDKPELEYIYNSIRQLRIITGYIGKNFIHMAFYLNVSPFFFNISVFIKDKS